MGSAARRRRSVSLHHLYITEETWVGEAGEMPTNSELLISLRKGFEDLEVFDDSGLNALRDRGQMSIRRVFGENSSYGDDPPILSSTARGRSSSVLARLHLACALICLPGARRGGRPLKVRPI